MKKNIPLSTDLLNFIELYYQHKSTEFIDSLQVRKKSSIRLNPLKYDPEKTIHQLELSGIQLHPTLLNNVYQYSPETGFPGRTLEHHLGYFYLQNLSSMIPVIVLDPKPNEIIIDLAAAPGSKTTQIADLMENTGLIIANEIDKNRISNLHYNLDRLGILNTVTVLGDGSRVGQLFPEFADKILLDAPCSALGVLSNQHEVAGWWNLQKVHKFSHIQKSLLISAIKAVKPGGTIVYSTCTLTPEENEQVIHEIMKDYPIEIVPFELPSEIPVSPGLLHWKNQTFHDDLIHAKRIDPIHINYQGFFICLLRKKGSTHKHVKHVPNHHRPKSSFEKVASKDRIQFITESIKSYYGISLPTFSRFYDSGDLWLLNYDLPGWSLPYFHRIGMRILRPLQKNEQFKTTTDFLQVFGRSITNNKLVFEEKDASQKDIFLSGGNIHLEEELWGQKAVFTGELSLGAGLAQGHTLKSQIPRSKRMLNESDL